MNNRKRSMLKTLRKNDGASGYYIMKHMTWLLRLPYSRCLVETALLIDRLILLGYRFTPDELAIIARVMRKGETRYFTWFESGEYVPTEHDLLKIQGKLRLQQLKR